MPDFIVPKTTVASMGQRLRVSEQELDHILQRAETASQHHITQSFVCPCCGEPVVAFVQQAFHRSVTLMNCITPFCKGGSSLTPDEWCARVGWSTLPLPLTLTPTPARQALSAFALCVLHAITHHLLDHDTPPSVDALTTACAADARAVADALDELEAHGVITAATNTARTAQAVQS